MGDYMKKINGVLILFLNYILLEIIFNINTFGTLSIGRIGLFAITLFPLAFIISLVGSILKQEIVNKYIKDILLVFATLVYISQLIYFKIYGAVFSLTSLLNGGQVADFKAYIVDVITRNIVTVLLMLVILGVLIFINHKFVEQTRFSFKKKSNVIVLTVSIVFMISSVLAINFDNDLNKAVYRNTSAFNVAKELGVTNSFIVEVRKNIFGIDEALIVDDSSNTTEEPIEIPSYDANVLEIDFEELLATEEDEKIKSLHTYFKSQTPSYQNEYTGLFEGKNLIVILAESFDSIAVDKEITPTLYKLYEEGFTFTNHYVPLFPVSTSDGEYMARTSLIPADGKWSMKASSDIELPYVLGNQFDDYSRNAYHNWMYWYYRRDLSHPNLGYNFKACKLGLEMNCDLWMTSDLEMMEASVEEYIKEDQFLTYYVTMSGHLEYKTMNAMSRRNKDAVADLDYSFSVKNYMAQHVELDKALAYLIEQLELAGKLEDTVIAINTDHYPYGLTPEQLNEKSDFDRTDKFDLHKTPLIIWNSETEGKKIDKLASSLDVLPTLSNLFGIEYDSRLMMGVDLFSTSNSMVILSDSSFITELGRYDNVTGVFSDETVDQRYVDKMKQVVENKILVSKLILENDYYSHLSINEE